MLTIKDNLRETLKGGKPDRFVNQYEYISLVPDPVMSNAGVSIKPGETKYNGWGVKICFQENTPGAFPVCEGDDKLLKDVTQWREVIKAPRTEFTDEEWAPFLEMASKVDRNEYFLCACVYTGIFEKLHYFMGMEDAMMNFYEEPEEMHALIDFLADWEIAGAKETISHMHPDALFHHDDWGSQKSSFMSPAMFEEFIEPAYKKIYGYWKANGVEVVVHHSDSYAANLVPSMIRMGIDVWQGAVSDNNIPELLKKYGGQIAIQGGLDNGKYDKPDWSSEEIHAGLKALFDVTEPGKYLIPSMTMGGPESVYPGEYEAVTAEIAKLSKEYFK